MIDDTTQNKLVEQQAIQIDGGKEFVENMVGVSSKVDKGPPSPSRDVPAKIALARQIDRVGEPVKSKEKAGDASVSKGVGDNRRLKDIPAATIFSGMLSTTAGALKVPTERDATAKKFDMAQQQVNLAALAKSSTVELRASQVVNLKVTTDGDATGVKFLDGKIATDGEAVAKNYTQLQEPMTDQPSTGAQTDCFMIINTGQTVAAISNVKEVLHEDVKGDNSDEDNEEGWSSVTRKNKVLSGMRSPDRTAGDKKFCSVNAYEVLMVDDQLTNANIEKESKNKEGQLVKKMNWQPQVEISLLNIVK
ncbi:hypothetical protein A4A49_25155 [Nicotiana attenuata]|uniref:Uncharacterized protein n=1 Tax=Nicotiana attenuata TaxID=49451 RepID=A0A314KLG0_NICAT|nr:hypothetical protein A4A49_25155 [Nicotiana attenuata]